MTGQDNQAAEVHGERTLPVRSTLGRMSVTGLVVLGVAAVLGGMAARADVVTSARDSLRTGWDVAEPTLNPASVASSSFGQLFSTAVDGQVYAQPLVVGRTLVAATENNVVYGLDALTGARTWSRSLGSPWAASTLGCGDVTPSIGVTSTPVYDPATNSVFLLAKTDDGADATQPHWYMHALDPATGAERSGFPVTIGGAPTNDPSRPFNPMTAMQRPGLLLLDGVVYAGFASHCDHPPFVGYVAGVSTSGVLTTLWATESGNSYAEGGIWQSGGGLVSDGPGQILFATGNGISPPRGPGSAPPATLAESIVRLHVGGDGNLTPTDFFSPSSNVQLDENDADLGSGGPLAVPDGYGTTAHPHLLVHVGKDGHVRLLDRDALGGMGQGPQGGDAVLDTAGPYNGVWGKPAFLGTTSGGYVYEVENGGYLRALRLSPGAGGSVGLASVGTSAGTFGYTSGSPAVTSNGTDGSSALVWVVYAADATGRSAQLRAYRALPDSSGILQQVFSAPIGVAAKFSSVATDGGRVYVGTRDGHVLAFGTPTTAAVGAASTDLGSAPVGQSVTGSVRITASRAVAVTSVTTDAPFTVGAVPQPLALAAGQSQDIPIAFAPTTTGQTVGVLTVGTADGETVRLDVHGTGTRDGLAALPAALAFDEVPTQTSSRATVNVVNTGTTPVTISGVSLPASSSFQVDPRTLPAAGQRLDAQASLPLSVTFTPSAAGAVADSLTVTSDLGAVQVQLSGTAVAGAAHLSVPATLDFGAVPVGISATRSFAVQNTGNVPMTITKAKAPAGVFSTTTPISEGLVVPPGDTAYQTVTFTPSATGQAGTADTFYLVTADDGQGAQKVMLTGTGVDDPIAVLAQRLGPWPGSPVGQALSLEYPVAGGTCQDYTNGVICYSASTGAHEVHGAIAARYEAAGGAAGPLGFPVTDETATPDGVGRFNHFSKGASIYWSPATGAHSVQGLIRQEWAALGWEQGPMGYPVTDETGTPDGVGRFNHFSKGASIYWSPATGAHSVQGLIRQEWAALGWERSTLGYPVTDEFSVPTGRESDFRGGRLVWNSRTGQISQLR